MVESGIMAEIFRSIREGVMLEIFRRVENGVVLGFVCLVRAGIVLKIFAVSRKCTLGEWSGGDFRTVERVQ